MTPPAPAAQFKDVVATPDASMTAGKLDFGGLAKGELWVALITFLCEWGACSDAACVCATHSDASGQSWRCCGPHVVWDRCWCTRFRPGFGWQNSHT